MEEHKSRSAPKCATCKHYGRNLNNIRKDAYGYVSIPPPYCYHPNTPVDLVTGGSETWAHDMRLDNDKCGESGAWCEKYGQESPTPTTEPRPVRKWWKFWS